MTIADKTVLVTGASRRGGVCGGPAARDPGRRHGDGRGRCVRVHAAQAALPPALPRDRGPGLGFGLCCAGSSAGLMAMLVALGVMSIGRMAVIAALVTARCGSRKESAQ